MQITFRTRPGVASPDYAGKFLKDMKRQLMAGNFWVSDVREYRKVRADFLANSLEDSGRKLFSALGVFFLVNVFLAVIGTFWFRVNRRKGELGLRMAVGSSRRTIRQLVVGDGLLILTIVGITALLLCVNMASADMLSPEVLKVTVGRLIVVSL